tara:strand:+ start:296 stop:526 length:231 start_codon:yes stop_codon:yes gene_type:complete
MSSSEDLDSILERLNTLSEEEEMDIGDIVKAVVGKESDEELEDWVRAAFEDIDRSLNLVEMAQGILAIRDWREQQA